MLFDTDIFIWVQRGNPKAVKLMEKETERFLSVQTYMELLQCARSKIELKNAKDFLSDYEFEILGFTSNIGHRAAIYIEEYTIQQGIRAGDAIIAATAMENNLTLCSSNQKHFKCINDLRLQVFKP